MKTRHFVLIAILFSLLACGEVPCAKGLLHIRMIGFTEAEVDTIILRRYVKNGAIAIDSFVFDSTNPVRVRRFGDTLMPVAYLSTFLMQSDHDYEYFFPEANRTYRITEISEEQSYMEKGLFNSTKESCVNEISGLKLNGQPVTVVGFPNSIYLRK